MTELGTQILVVDDEVFFREAIVEVLTGAGYECRVCEDGESAAKEIEDPQIGVVVLDMRLPGIDGLEVLRQIEKLRPQLRVIMLSASTDQELVLEALRLGACDYLAKPLHDEELALAVGRALQGHAVAASRDRLRDRLDLLVERVQDLSRRSAACEGEERLALLRQGAVEAASDILGVEKASIMMLDPDRLELEVVASVGREIDASDMDRVSVGQGIAGRALDLREALLVNDVAEDERFEACDDQARYRSKSFAVAPLETFDRSLGVLCVTDRKNGGGLEEEDLALLRLLALQISELMTAGEAGADSDSDSDSESEVDEMELTRDLNDTAPNAGLADDAELARLVCDAVVSEVEPQRLIDAVLKPLVDALGAAPVSIFLVDGASGALVLEGECDGGTRAERRKLEPGCGLTGLVAQTGNLIAAADPAQDPRFDPEVDTPVGGEAAPLLCVPLKLRGRVFGIFRAFLQADALPDARTGEVLSAALSAAVRNVLLYRSLVDSIAEVAEARRAAGTSR